MIKVLLSGACGKMGRTIANCAKDNNDISIISGVDSAELICDFPVFKSFGDVKELPDVVIDFSNVAVLDDLLAFVTKNKIPAVIATTGFTKEQIEKIHEASKSTAIFFTANMSLGVNLLCNLARQAATILCDDFDIEIVEKHHNQKLDAPSGTAIMLGNAINSQLNDKFNYEYDRHSKRQKRQKNEIGIHSIRGGSIVGEHDVIFAGRDEVITLSHSAQSKEIFAVGAIKAASFIANKPAGLYDMGDILNI